MNEDNKIFACIYFSCNIYYFGVLEFFLKSWRMRIWHAIIFLSLLAGKLRQFEQSAGVTQVMEIFRRRKRQITQRQQTFNQRMCKRHKVRLSIFFGPSTLIVQKVQGLIIFF